MTRTVGVAIPAYNCERYIESCIFSALDQDIPDLGVYVVDDASTDTTMGIVRGMAQKFPNAVAWRSHEFNSGIGATRQHAISMALEDGCTFVALLDGDDLRKRNTIRIQVQELERADDAAVCYARTDYINSRGRPHAGTWWERCAELVKGHPEGEVWAHLISRGKLGTTDTIIVRGEAARQCCYDPDLPYFEDVDYLAQLATLPSKSNFVFVDKVVASYRFHAQQSPSRLSTSLFARRAFDIKRQIALRVFHRLNDQGRAISPRIRRRLLRMLVFRSIADSCRESDFALARSLALAAIRPLTRIEREYDNAFFAVREDEMRWRK